jgi:hypothetical protein
MLDGVSRAQLRAQPSPSRRCRLLTKRLRIFQVDGSYRNIGFRVKGCPSSAFSRSADR